MKPARLWKIQDQNDLREKMQDAYRVATKAVTAGPIEVGIARPNRTLDQNAKLWAMLADVARQVDWYGHDLSAEDWKNIFTASLINQRAVPGIEGGFVVLGTGTSGMDRRTFADLIELIYAFGSERQVIWSEKALAAYESYAEAIRARNQEKQESGQ